MLARRPGWLSLLAVLSPGCGDGDKIILPPPPAAICAPPVSPVDTSTATATVGDGTPESCNEAALRDALSQGGIVVFSCGPDPITLPIKAEIEIAADTVLDGGGLVTLDGQDQTRILVIRSTFDQASPRLTVQNLTFQGGRTDDVPNTTEVDQGGAAIFRVGGSLTIIDSVFVANHGPSTGQDVGGGAVYSLGGGPTIITGSIFADNSASNAGAIGNLGADLVLVNSTVSQNEATGEGGNPGNGGNGGGIAVDGRVSIEMCGVTVEKNQANAFGGGIFRVGPDGTEPTTIDRSVFDQNAIPDRDPSLGGGVYLQSTIITLTRSAITRNEARAAGGFFVGPGARADLENVTIAQNSALSSLGGGLSIDGSASGTFSQVTIAQNSAPGEFAFAAGIAGGGGVTLRNSLLFNPEVGNGFNPINCTQTQVDGGGNVQFPVLRAGGGSDEPGNLCAAGALLADPLLGELVSQDGTFFLVPSPKSPARGLGQNCPALDQRGQARGASCTAGAVE